MQLNENARIDTSQVEDQRGSGGGLGGGGLPIPLPVGRGKGGMIITLIVVVASMLLGGGFGLNALTDGEGDNTALAEKCSGADRLEQLDCRNTLYVNSIQDYWQDALPQQFGKPYEKALTNYFSSAVNTGCGRSRMCK